MKFSSYAGDISIDPTHLQTFVKAWYNESDTIVLVAISVDAPRRKVMSQTILAKDLLEATPQEIEDLCMLGAEKFNTYVSVFPVKDENNVSFYSRGTKEDIKEVYGVFADLDVKTGAFNDKFEIRDFLYSLDVAPTLIIDNGKNGGVHAYWRLADDEIADEELLFMWWCYLSSKTDKKIDRLLDCTRISRMPSGIYWPKPGTDDTSDTVKVVRSDGPRHPLKKLQEVSKEAFEERKKKINDTIERDRLSKEEIKDIATEIYSEYAGDGYPWKAKLAIARLEDVVNEELSWDEILLPVGWSLKRELRDEAREWARPGQDARSAVTDYVHDDGKVSHVMSLFSESEETNLQDLLDANIVLTKYRVYLRLVFNDDEQAMLMALKERILKSDSTTGS